MGIEGWLERLVDIPEIVVPDTGIRINDIRDLSINVMPDWMRDPPQAVPTKERTAKTLITFCIDLLR